MCTLDFQRKGIPAQGFVRVVGFVRDVFFPFHLPEARARVGCVGRMKCLVPCTQFLGGEQ